MKRKNYKLPDEFVEKCVQALAFYDTVDEIGRLDNETQEEAEKRLKNAISTRKSDYRLMFIQNQ